MAKVAAIALILTWSLVPIAFILVSSFKPSADIFAVPPRLTFAPTVKHFVALWAQWRGFFTGLRNSAIVTAGDGVPPESATRPSTVASVGSCACACAVRSCSHEEIKLPRRHTSAISGSGSS